MFLRLNPCLRASGGRAFAVAIVCLVVVLTGCAAPAFDPGGPCGADGRMPGAYPDLEARIPQLFEGRDHKALDSGRNCSATALGSLAGHGVRELRFAGGQWSLGGRSGFTMAVLTGPTPLDVAWVEEFYEASARAARNTENIDAGRQRIGAVDAYRIQTLNGETSFQTVVVWPGDGVIDVVIVASDVGEFRTREAHDEIVERVVTAFAVPAGGG